ncbi:MAG: T9SS type A sorting domain-containing protein, partial [bacterium]
DIDGDTRTTPDIGADEYTSVGSPMSGIFTIKQQGGGDYLTFAQAFGDVQLRGFGGNVQFDVYDGTYTGIPGAGAAFNFDGIGNGPNRLIVRGYPGQTVNLPCNGYSYGIRLYGNKRVALENLRIYGFSSYGIYATSLSSSSNTTDSCVVRGNTITGPYPIYWYYGKDDSIIGNYLNATSSYGLFVYGTSASYGQRNVIANNMISGYTSYGLYLYYQNLPEVYSNTIASASANSSYNGLYGQYVTNLTMKNNIFWNRNQSYAVAFWNSTFAGTGASNYNNFFASSMLGVWNGMGYTDLAQWRSGTGQDANSISANPLLASNTDLHLTGASPCKDVGTVVTGFAYDIDGDVRPIGSAADIGADEYFVDLGITAIIAPAGGVGVGSTVAPRVQFVHLGGPAGSNYVKMVLTNNGTPVYAESTLVTSSVGDTIVVSLPNWVAGPIGSNFAAAAWHKAMPDASPANDSIGAAFQVGNVDVAVTAVLAPAASTPLGATVAPAVVVTNLGDFAAIFDLAFTVDDGALGGDALNAGTPRRKVLDALVYSQTVSVNLAYGATDTIVFDTTWLATPAGDYTAEAQALALGDTDPGNDSIVLAVSVDRMDVGVSAVTAPVGNVSRTNLYPAVKVMNYGDAAAVCDVRFVIRDAGNTVVYDRIQAGIIVPLGDSAAFSFTTPWLPLAGGVYTHEATTQLMYDQDATNDSAFGTCTVADSGVVPTAWEPKASMPATPSGKMQKDGSWLVYHQGNGLIYAAKGYKVGDFYSYDPVADAWTQLPEWPLGLEAKGPSKGSIACTDGNGAIYATKGNNRSGFWKYTIAESAWTQLVDVPLGLSNKKVKGGTDMVYVQEDTTGWVYVLKGYKTEFYRYNTNLGTWETLADAPTGVKAKYDKGSWLAYDGIGRTIYAHKAKYGEMYAYDLDSMAWGTVLPAMPLANQQTGKNKKSKDGGSAAYLNDGLIYALKGGNTCEFYAYDPAAMLWSEKDTIDQLGPVGKKKRVKGGGDITSMNGEVLYAFKGNKSNELWKYSPMFAASIRPARSGVMAERVLPQGFDVKLGPNPLLTGVATLRYTLPAAGAATVKVVDVTGRTVLTRSLAVNRLGSTQLDLRSLSAGVYLVKLTSDGSSASVKLVIR